MAKKKQAVATPETEEKKKKKKSRAERGSLKPTLSGFSSAIDEVLTGIKEEMYEAVDRGLDKASEYLKGKLEAATPIDTAKTRTKWEANLKYRNVRYINNTALNEQNIPIVNLLEFAEKGNPFVRKTVSENEAAVVEIIKNEIEKK